MKKYMLALMALIALPVMAQSEYDTIDEPIDLEPRLVVSSFGTLGASVRNYTGSRFDSEVGASDEKSNEFKIPRIGLRLNYKLTNDLSISSEMDYVNNSELQLRDLAFHYTLAPAFTISGGIMKLPIGHSNSDYSHVDYFTLGEPEGETAILPYPMTEAGLSFSGKINKIGLDYNLCATTGFDATSINTYYWAKDCSNSLNGDGRLQSPAATLRLGFSGIKNLQVGAGIYYCPNAMRNSTYYDIFKAYYAQELKTPLTIYFADLQYKPKWFTLRGSFLEGNLGNSYYLTYLFKYLQENNITTGITYTSGNIAKIARTYMGEFALNFKNIFNLFLPEYDIVPELYPFVHYEYYNSQEQGQESSVSMNIRGKVSLWSFGLNWQLSKGFVIKCNYTTRKIGEAGSNYNAMNDINLGMAYDFTFLEL